MTVEEAEAYDCWFRAKVERSLADTRPGIPHGQELADMRALIDVATKRQKRD
ncbi:type II toxin-antitoxin system RelB family antitoxin [Paraburkholderia sp. GAS42]|uniref:type II toxin-antitoxin system RelB family antitoxin n=1 Tax=Paraburkholderia sp. GAS42 TaxID=3035135 RepID=UPI003D1C2842